MSFRGQVAAITGAGSGIGRALAIELAGLGCNVAISDLDEKGLEETRSQVATMNVGCLVTSLDVSDRKAVEAWSDQVVNEFGHVDYVFNNAGVALFDSAESMEYEHFEWIMNINFWGMIYGSKAFLRHFKKAGQGHVINVSSLFGLVGYPGQSAYNSSKFAIRGYTEALALELDGTNIHASSVHPGGVGTDIARNSRLVSEYTNGATREEIAKRFEAMVKTTPEQAAKIILQGVQKRKRRILVGKDAKILDLIQRFAPEKYGKFLLRALQ
ncbi:SDR family NAD(P)-dependent oxidoreductase [Sneathiella limimaris]|uniref:SDR family NAD(P)-dependent oxidoreductase n=1 Tax=Sneathiella limimaris TaxID=1964213 RepID=UPI00146BFE28|nr:SDR family oxidoreductase [Sneathiella limimaris]